MRQLALGFALGVVIACGTASGVESMAILQDLTVKGVQAAQEADELMKKDQGSMALIVMNRHMREVDAAIDKARNDPAISAEHKTLLVTELRKYASDVKRSRDHLRALVDLQAEMGR